MQSQKRVLFNLMYIFMKECFKRIAKVVQCLFFESQSVDCNLFDEFCERFVWDACGEDECFDGFDSGDVFDA